MQTDDCAKARVRRRCGGRGCLTPDQVHSCWRPSGKSRRQHVGLPLDETPVTLDLVTAAERFTFRFADAYRRPARLFGITPETAWVDTGQDTLRALGGLYVVRGRSLPRDI